MYDKQLKRTYTQGFDSLADLQTLSRALVNRWPIPDEVKAAALEAITNIIQMKNPTHPRALNTILKLKLQAVKVLGQLDALNVKLISAFIPKQVVHLKPEEMSDEELEEAILIKAESIKNNRTKVLDTKVCSLI